jgi:hypothetical protein
MDYIKVLAGIIFFVNQKSQSKNKKYGAIIPNGQIKYFGSLNYDHYYDKIGYYSNLNHLDEKRRKNYISRHMGVKSNGISAPLIEYSPSWFSLNYLW